MNNSNTQKTKHMPNSPDRHRVLYEFGAECKRLFGDRLSDVRLFGSCARGDYNEESDIDVMLLLNMDRAESKRYLDEVCHVTSELDMKYGVFLSPILQSKPEYDAAKSFLGFFKNVEHEGVSIYA